MVAIAKPKPTGQIRVANRFSNFFIPGLPKPQSELDFADVLVDTDIPLFVDPYAFKIGSSDFANECNDLVVSFFQELVNALREERSIDATELLQNLHEPNETRLGLSKGVPQGRGVGGLQAKALYNAFAKSKAVKTGLLKDLSDCELFIEGIGTDKISDITINIIRAKLVDFTKEQCKKWNIPMHFKPTGPFWNAEAKEWHTKFDFLPVYNGYPIILVPKKSLRYKLAIDDREYYDFHVVDFIKQEMQRQENLNSNRSLLKTLHGGRRITKKEVKVQHPFSKANLLKFSEDHPAVLAKYKSDVEAKMLLKGAPSDMGIHEKVKETAHIQNLILIEEAHFMNENNFGGSNYGVAGLGNHGNRIFIGSISNYKSEVDAATNIDSEMKNLLKLAIDAIESSEAKTEEKDDAKENLKKLTEELNSPTKEPGRIRRFVTRIAEVVPAVATILGSGKAIADVISAAAS